MRETTKIPALPFSWVPQNKMLICSLATGAKHIALLQVMAPTVAYYAMKYKMDSLLLPLPDMRLHASRPPAWDKMIMINHALKLYDTVMWIDADAIIVDPSKDIRKALDTKYPMHLVAHHIGRKTKPNTGIWICQKYRRTFKLLEAIWNNHKYINHNWWEQVALMDLIGYDPDSCAYRGPTRYSSYIRYLDRQWNSRSKDTAEHPVIHHFCNKSKPIEEMQAKYSEFLQKIQVKK